MEEEEFGVIMHFRALPSCQGCDWFGAGDKGIQTMNLNEP